MDYQKSYVLMWVGIIAGFILAAVGGALAIKWLAAMGALILLAGILQTFLFFRCPHCGGHWDTRGGVPPLLSGVRGVHLVKCFHNGKTRPLCLQQSGLAILEQAV